jgi:hypothetical protein
LDCITLEYQRGAAPRLVGLNNLTEDDRVLQVLGFRLGYCTKISYKRLGLAFWLRKNPIRESLRIWRDDTMPSKIIMLVLIFTVDSRSLTSCPGACLTSTPQTTIDDRNILSKNEWSRVYDHTNKNTSQPAQNHLAVNKTTSKPPSPTVRTDYVPQSTFRFDRT